MALLRERSLWYRVTLIWFSITGWVVFVTSWLTARIEHALRQKDAAQATAEHEGARRLVSDEQRFFTETALIEAQRHEAVGRVAGGVSHDFNNALFVILGWNDLLSQGDVTAEQRVQGHTAIATAGRNAAELARRLVTLGRDQPGPPYLSLLKPLVEDGVRYLSRLLPDDIRVGSDLAEVPPVDIDPGQVQQLLLNLALHARDAMPGGGDLHFTLRVAHAGNGSTRGAGGAPGWIELGVQDTGPGMDEFARQNLFEPRPATDPQGSAWLGLATTHAIVRRAGGRIEVESAPGRGTRIRVLVPTAPERAGPVPPSAADGPARIARVLVVEDDYAVRELIVLALRRHGHEVRAAASGDDALALLDAAPAEHDLLCIDGILPGAPAITVIQRFRVVCPGCPVLVCSGNLGTPQLLALVESESVPVLAKPFTTHELCGRVDQLLLEGSADGCRG